MSYATYFSLGVSSLKPPTNPIIKSFSNWEQMISTEVSPEILDKEDYVLYSGGFSCRESVLYFWSRLLNTEILSSKNAFVEISAPREIDTNIISWVETTFNVPIFKESITKDTSYPQRTQYYYFWIAGLFPWDVSLILLFLREGLELGEGIRDKTVREEIIKLKLKEHPKLPNSQFSVVYFDYFPRMALYLNNMEEINSVASKKLGKYRALSGNGFEAFFYEFKKDFPEFFHELVNRYAETKVKIKQNWTIIKGE